MNGTTAYILSKRYLKKSLNGTGALAGAPAQIDSITKITGGNEVRFKWQGNDGSVQYSSMTVMDGVSAVKAELCEVDGSVHLIITMSNGSEFDAGIIPAGTATTDFTIDTATGQLLYKGMEINIARTNGYSIQSVTLEEYNQMVTDGSCDKKTVYIIDDDNSADMESSGFYLNENNQLMYNGIPVDAATVDGFSIRRVTKEAYLELKASGTADLECIYLIDDDTGETVIP